MLTNLLEVLALKLGDELVKALLIGVDADGGEDSLDIGGRGGLVAGEGEEEESGDVLHFESGSTRIPLETNLRSANVVDEKNGTYRFN